MNSCRIYSFCVVTEAVSNMSRLETKDSKRVLIVFAHQKHDSFNGALLRTAVDTLTSGGHVVEVSDLYAMNFDPVLRCDDCNTAQIPEDIQSEIEKVERADLIVFQFPVFWSAVPAILKGWVDRVFQAMSISVCGGAYVYEEGILKGKKAMVSLTTGAYTMSEDVVKVAMAPIHNGTFFRMRLGVLPMQYTHRPEFMDAAEREKALSDWSVRLTAIFDEPVLEGMGMCDWVAKCVSTNF